MGCGPTCLKMVCEYYGKKIQINTLKTYSNLGKDGVSLLGIADAAERIGLRARTVRLTYTQLIEDAPKPVILYWDQNHFVVFLKEKWKKNVVIADPARDIIKYSKEEFLKYWLTDKYGNSGIALLLEPTDAFFQKQNEQNKKSKKWEKISNYFFFHKQQLLQIIIAILIGSIIQLSLPFFTQSIVDTGIRLHDIQYVYIILLAQFALFISKTSVDLIRGRILLFLSTRINISLLSDFWIKLLKLPTDYFDTKHAGDIIQRLGDHKRIEAFLTGTALNTLFSILNLITFSFLLLRYSLSVFVAFFIGSFAYYVWISFFLKYRRSLDYKSFDIASKENITTMQLIQGIHEIKLNNAEQRKRWEWESIQASLFKLTFKSLTLSQYQQGGAFFINEGKNLLITFYVAQATVNGVLTLGEMMAIQYIVAQLNSPIEQLIQFVQQLQDARISLERLNEIDQVEDENPSYKSFISYLPAERSIYIKNLSFTYPGSGNGFILKNINLIIPQSKITAVVGTSGSGKTTLIKLLLKTYTNFEGVILIGDQRLENISSSFWRSMCGAVMQDGFIFNDTIANNITISRESRDENSLLNACKVANILSFIENLPLGFNTKLGSDGIGLSQGQKQRILIARAIYKNPEFLFLDEATNALDSTNEKNILTNLNKFFKGKTVIVVAHRLSTVKQADNIIVIHNGSIAEQGTHEKLIKLKGYYYELIKNQLELAN